MPTYEMPIIIRLMAKPQLHDALKGVASSIFGSGGYIRGIENWGEKTMPMKMSAHGTVHRQANHFLLTFDAPPSSLQNLQFEFRQNSDVVRAVIFKKQECEPVECTIAEDFLPPVYRKDVAAILAGGRRTKRKTKIFKHNTGLEVHPF